MAQDIVPIELGLPQGDVITLWAPRWREEGEEWEAFLGDEDALYAFSDAANLAAFVRTSEEHDLADHPAWNHVPRLSVGELMPEEDYQFDLVGLPELMAQAPDTWSINDLAAIVTIARSLAEVCDLETVNEVLDSSEGFALLASGSTTFTGKEGKRLWENLSKTVATRWDEVLDAIDGVVRTPDVPAQAVTAAQAELDEELEETDADEQPEESITTDDAPTEEAEAGFWAETGIDPIKIITTTGEFYTLRCYVEGDPLFLGTKGRIDVFSSPNALARYLADEEANVDNDLAALPTWENVTQKATAGELEINVDEDNTYVLVGLDEDIHEGPTALDPNQLELAEELLTDAASWAGDAQVDEALKPSERLGWLVSFVISPSPTRLTPSPPFDEEVAAWRQLVHAFEDRLEVH